MHLDDALDALISKMIAQLSYFTKLKSLNIMDPRMICCDTVTLVRQTLPSLGKHLEYFKFTMPKKVYIKLIDVKHIFSTLSNQKLFPCLKIIHVEQNG